MHRNIRSVKSKPKQPRQHRRPEPGSSSSPLKTSSGSNLFTSTRTAEIVEITGKNGSGKTSILDAICVRPYRQAEGNQPQNRSRRCKRWQRLLRADLGSFRRSDRNFRQEAKAASTTSLSVRSAYRCAGVNKPSAGIARQVLQRIRPRSAGGFIRMTVKGPVRQRLRPVRSGRGLYEEIEMANSADTTARRDLNTQI